MHHLRAIFFGLLIVVLLSLVAGPMGPMAIALLVVCTGGLGLIPLLLVSWLVGLLALYLLDRGEEGTPEPPGPARKPDQAALLVGYIQKARNQGVAEPKIEEALVGNGWSRDEITEAYRRLGGR